MKPFYKFSYALAAVLFIGIALLTGCSGAPAAPTATTPAANLAPAVSSIDAPKEVFPGATANITCVAADPNNDALTYAWASKSGSISGSGASVQWTAPTEAGSYTVDVTVTDGKGGQAAGTASINVAAKPNQAPKITSFTITHPDKSVQTVTPGDGSLVSVQYMTTITIVAEIQDPEGDSYNVLWSCTDGAKIEGKDKTVKLLALTKNTDLTVTVTLIDSRGAFVKTILPVKIPCCGEGQFGKTGT
jgi:hypothetical protein